uniref:hypothetical protein n=1 Tax=Collinsella sp. TaxID=1965294 RepID=UPI003FF05291
MYVIAIKNRQSEFAAMKILQEKSLLRDDMIPLVEVIQEKFTYDNKIDPFTGETVREEKVCKGGKIIHRAVKDLSSPHDVTLEKIPDYSPIALYWSTTSGAISVDTVISLTRFPSSFNSTETSGYTRPRSSELLRTQT